CTMTFYHRAANQRAFAVAIEQAVQAVQRQVPQRIAARLESVYPAGFELLDGGKSGTCRCTACTACSIATAKAR
ncbi:hypothetical protein ACUOFC_64920, partial [Escherichia sp. TWPC-MK]